MHEVWVSLMSPSSFPPHCPHLFSCLCPESSPPNVGLSSDLGVTSPKGPLTPGTRPSSRTHDALLCHQADCGGRNLKCPLVLCCCDSAPFLDTSPVGSGGHHGVSWECCGPGCRAVTGAPGPVSLQRSTPRRPACCCCWWCPATCSSSTSSAWWRGRRWPAAGPSCCCTCWLAWSR